jgi:hypothetical protein
MLRRDVVACVSCILSRKPCTLFVCRLTHTVRIMKTSRRWSLLP